MTNQDLKKAPYWTGLSATALAIVFHLYLLTLHYGLQFGSSTGESICNVGSTFNCEAVSASRFSEFLGVPLALWGVLTNLLLLAYALLASFQETDALPRYRRLVLTWAGLVSGASIVMGAISAIYMSAYCLFCLINYVLSFIAFGAFCMAFPRQESWRSWKWTEVRTLAITGIGLLLAAQIANSGASKSYSNAVLGDIQQFARAQADDWAQSPPRTIQPVQPLVMGASESDARMTIVEFADFRCGHCKSAAPVLHAFALGNPGVRLIFQAWPLDGECNKAIPQAVGASCHLARIVFCAEKQGQGRGWAAHDWIFEHQEEWATVSAIDSRLEDMCKATGLNCSEIQTCKNSDEIKAVTEQQAAVIPDLKGTPSIFVNGRLLGGGQSLHVLKEVYKRLQ